MKCQTYLSTIICATFIAVVVTNATVETGDSAEEPQIPRIHPGFKELDYGIVMMIQMGIFGRCYDNPLVNMNDANLEYIKFYRCTVTGSNAIAEKYNFPSGDEFDKESFKQSPYYPVYICEFYQTVHGCLPGLIPHLAGCLNITTSTIYKAHTGYKHVLQYGCENNATVLTELYSDKLACKTGGSKQTTENIMAIFEQDEVELFSTPESCRQFATTKEQYLNQINGCSDSIRTIFVNGFNRFWVISGCTN